MPPQIPVRLISVTDARATLSRLIAALHHDAERAKPILVARHGEPFAALISIEQFHDYCTLATQRRRQLEANPALHLDLSTLPFG